MQPPKAWKLLQRKRRLRRASRFLFLTFSLIASLHPIWAGDSPCPLSMGFALSPVNNPVPFDAIIGGESTRGSVTVPVAEGEKGRYDVYACVVSDLNETEGVQGFSLSVEITGDAICDGASLNGMAWDADPSRSGGFRRSECVVPAKNSGRHGAVGANVMSFTNFAPLAPVGTFALMKLTLESKAAQTSEESRATVEFRDGLRGSGQPVQNAMTVAGRTVEPCRDDAELVVHFQRQAQGPFVRGDANHDGRLDVSDPVTLLRHFFHGDAEIRCSDAGDVNDDGKLDIADAITSFGYLFLGHREPPSPFPQPGEDPTADELRCSL